MDGVRRSVNEDQSRRDVEARMSEGDKDQKFKGRTINVKG